MTRTPGWFSPLLLISGTLAQPAPVAGWKCGRWNVGKYVVNQYA